MKKDTVFPVGHNFIDYNNDCVRLEVVKQNGCKGCFYNHSGPCDCCKHTSSIDRLACGSISRGIAGGDYTSVIFKQVPTIDVLNHARLGISGWGNISSFVGLSGPRYAKPWSIINMGGESNMSTRQETIKELEKANEEILAKARCNEETIKKLQQESIVSISAIGEIVDCEITQSSYVAQYTRGQLCHLGFKNDTADKEYIEFGQAFVSEEAAEQNKIRTIGQQLIKRMAVQLNNNHDWRFPKYCSAYRYYVCYGSSTGLKVLHHRSVEANGMPVFDTEHKAIQCLEALKKQFPNEREQKIIFGMI